MNENSFIALHLLGTLLLGCTLLGTRRFVAACLLGVYVVAFVTFARSVLDYLAALGSDSFVEVLDFDLIEARGFAATAVSLIEPERLALGRRRWVILAGLLAAMLLAFRSFTLSTGSRLVIGGILAVTPLVLLSTANLELMRQNAIEATQSIERVIDGSSFNLVGNAASLGVVVFIGESTSTMNLGLYGYLRDTTPRLTAARRTDENLLVFDNVLSTHVHTSPSLQEALSFAPSSEREALLPIFKRNRVSLIDVLERAGVRTHLVSNQTRHGSWNTAASAVFRSASNLEFSVDGKFAGNLEWRLDRPEEGAFFERHLARLQDAPTPSVTFLHSYIGHYYYKQNLPDRFDVPIDGFWDGLPLSTIFGTRIPNKHARGMVEASDRSYRYLDHVLSNVIHRTRQSERPLVLVYFADHGDAVYAGVAHDSARFQHEMLRVPFIVHFNAAARSSYPILFKRFKRLSETGKLATLAQFPSTLLALFDLAAAPGLGTPLIGDSYEKSGFPILIRETADGVSFVDPWPAHPPRAFDEATDATDAATRLLAWRASGAVDQGKLCYQGTSSIAKALRGLLVSDCLALSVTSNGADDILVASGEDDNPLQLDKMLAMLRERRFDLWLSGNAIGEPVSCRALYSILAKESMRAAGTVVAFPSHTDLVNPRILECARSLSSLGAIPTFSIAAEADQQCVKIQNRSALDADMNCVGYAAIIDSVIHSGVFTALEFEHTQLPAIERIGGANSIDWYLRNVSSDALTTLVMQRFERIGVDTSSDPNSR